MPHAERTPIEPPSLIVVTGANGFIASHTIHLLLKAGYRVLGTVRTAQKAELVQKTHAQLTPDAVAAHLLRTAVVRDITDPEAYTALFQTATPPPAAIMHMASPFGYDVTDFERDLMQPAVRGTSAVLSAALATSSVRRVIHTNSFACIYDASLGLRPGYTYTARDWCPLTYEDGVDGAKNAPMAYRASRAVAEKTAWSFMSTSMSMPMQASEQRKAKAPSFDMVSLCPAMVFGPFLDTPSSLPRSPDELNTSNKLVWDVVSAAGNDRNGDRDGDGAVLPPTKGPVWIDVRDVALAHVKCLVLPSDEMRGRRRRLMLAKGVYCNQEIADVSREVVTKQKLKQEGRIRIRIPVGKPGTREAHTHFAVDASEEEALLGDGGKWRGLKECMADLVPQFYRIE